MQKIRVFWFVLFVLVFLWSPTFAQQSPLPQHEGELVAVGLNDRVEVLRDSWGVPHIYASTLRDLYFAQGFTQAQDRWWQMEFFRHTGGGEIQELTGLNAGLMGTDVFLRTLGFREVAQRELEETYSAETVAALEAFAEGVNAYLESREPEALAVEYGVLGLTGVTVEITPWTAVDSIIWGKVMALDLSGNQSGERRLSRVYAAVDPALIEDWLVEWPYGDKPTILSAEDLPISDESLSAALPPVGAGIVGLDTTLAGGFEVEQLAALGLPVGDGIGSNNWVAGGSMTESGQPLMANDMHLGIQMPSIWYEVGLHCAPVSDACPLDVAGFALSPAPGVIAGHNADISWAFTNVGPDTQDLYQIRVNPENPLQYEYNGEWRDMTVREETLNFGNGADPVTFQVRVTHFGPIINDNALAEDGTLTGFNNEDPLALRWTALEPGTLFDGVRGLNQARDWDSFRAALQNWDTPAQNVIYADRQGNIGYQTPSRIPIRAADHTGLLPVPGWTDAYEWRGFIPFDLLPRVLNPERGYIQTANQAVVPLAYYDQLAEQLGGEFGADSNYFISQFWNYGYRGQRIDQLLQELAPHTVASFQAIHGDNLDVNAMEIMPYLADLSIDDAALAELRDWLLEWDFNMHKDSPHAALWGQFISALIEMTWNDQLMGTATAGSGDRWPTSLLMAEPEHAWWDDITTTDVIETRDDILRRAFEAASGATVEALGDDRESWTWGALHTATFISNPLGLSGIAPIERRVNRGPVASSGSSEVVNATSWAVGDFAVRGAPSERAIYDLSNWDNSVSMHTTGQSGHPDSVNYDDMIESWVNITYRPMPFSREAVEAAAVTTLVLVPGE